MDIYNTREAADYVHLGKPTLERFRLTGEGPKFCRLSRRAVRYRRSDLDAWLETRLVSSTSDGGAKCPPMNSSRNSSDLRGQGRAILRGRSQAMIFVKRGLQPRPTH